MTFCYTVTLTCVLRSVNHVQDVKLPLFVSFPFRCITFWLTAKWTASYIAPGDLLALV
jgi:hypothetical protein